MPVTAENLFCVLSVNLWCFNETILQLAAHFPLSKLGELVKYVSSFAIQIPSIL